MEAVRKSPLGGRTKLKASLLRRNFRSLFRRATGRRRKPLAGPGEPYSQKSANERKPGQHAHTDFSVTSVEYPIPAIAIEPVGKSGGWQTYIHPSPRFESPTPGHCCRKRRSRQASRTVRQITLGKKGVLYDSVDPRWEVVNENRLASPA